MDLGGGAKRVGQQLNGRKVGQGMTVDGHGRKYINTQDYHEGVHGFEITQHDNTNFQAQGEKRNRKNSGKTTKWYNQGKIEDINFYPGRRFNGNNVKNPPFTSEPDSNWEWQYTGSKILPGYPKEFYGYEYFINKNR